MKSNYWKSALLNLLLMVCFNIVSAQTFKMTGTALYQARLLDNDNVNKLLGYANTGGDIHHAVSAVRFALDFDEDASVFSTLANSQLSQQQIKSVELFTGVSSEKSWWQDSTASYYVMKKNLPLLTNDYLVRSSFQSDDSHTDWIITDETKEIGGYICFKASRTNVRQAPGTGERFAFPIIAWFSPDIPVPYGPKQYGGLPGLILEVQDEMVHFGVVSISFDEDVVVQEKPVYQEITDSDLTKILMESRDAFQKNRGKK